MPLESNDIVLNKKIKMAEKLRKPYGIILGIFMKTDYEASADLFMEVADEIKGVAEKEKYYVEAAETYKKMGGDSYGIYKASEVYRKLAALFSGEQSVKYLQLLAESLDSAGRYLLAGQAWQQAAEARGAVQAKVAVKGGVQTDSIHFFLNAIASFNKDGSCPFHKLKAMEKCLLILLQSKQYYKSMELLQDILSIKKNINNNYYYFALELLKILSNKDGNKCNNKDGNKCNSTINNAVYDILDNYDLDKDTNNIILQIINENNNEIIDSIDKYTSDNIIPDFLSIILDDILSRFSPENDIC